MKNATKQKNNLEVYIIIGLLIVIAVLVFSINFQINKYNKLENANYLLDIDNNKNIQYSRDLNTLLNEKIIKYDELGSKYLELQSSYLEQINYINNLSRDKNQLSTDYNQLNKDYTSLLNEINAFKIEITESMDWFKNNSTIYNLSDSIRLKSHLETCVSCDEDTCLIKTACINWFVNERKFYLKYEDDNIISNKEDKLQSLNSFLLNEAGDCEDYSLLFAAEIRYLIDYVVLEKEKIPIIEAIVEANTNSEYQITSSWYYAEGIKAYPLDRGYIYPNVACGTLYDPQTNEYNGHCVIMITNKDINQVSDLSSLGKIYLIEPQFGDFIDFAKYEGVLKTTKEDHSIIDMLITKKDLYMHESRFYNNTNYTSSNWYGYEMFLNEINNIKK
jgi:hypothetical protein